MGRRSAEDDSVEMRAAVRYPVRWPVELQHGRGVTRDISATGMYLKSSATVEQHAIFHFFVLLPQTAGVIERLECTGKAVRVERQAGGACGIGIALQDFHFSL